jgi:hypothetical protein
MRKLILVSMLAATPALGATPCAVWGSLEPCVKQPPLMPMASPAPAVVPQHPPAVVAQAPATVQPPMMLVYQLTGPDRYGVNPRRMSPEAAQAYPFCPQSTMGFGPGPCKVQEKVLVRTPEAQAFATAHAENWQNVGTDGDGHIWEFDMDSITKAFGGGLFVETTFGQMWFNCHGTFQAPHEDAIHIAKGSFGEKLEKKVCPH